MCFADFVRILRDMGLGWRGYMYMGDFVLGFGYFVGDLIDALVYFEGRGSSEGKGGKGIDGKAWKGRGRGL